MTCDPYVTTSVSMMKAFLIELRLTRRRTPAERWYEDLSSPRGATNPGWIGRRLIFPAMIRGMWFRTRPPQSGSLVTRSQAHMSQLTEGPFQTKVNSTTSNTSKTVLPVSNVRPIFPYHTSVCCALAYHLHYLRTHSIQNSLSYLHLLTSSHIPCVPGFIRQQCS